MSMQTAKRARLPLYKLMNRGRVLTSAGVQVEVRYYTRAMLESENSYFNITSRSWRFCQMWYLGYHGLEAIVQLSTGMNGMRTSNMVQVDTGCLSMSQDIPPSCSSKPLRSWTFFPHFHPVPREGVRLEALQHMPRSALTYTHRHTSRMVLACSMSPKRKMVSPMRSAATRRLNTSRC